MSNLLHRNRRTRNPVRKTLDTLLALRRYVAAIGDFGNLLGAGSDPRLRPVGDLAYATMAYIDGELDALETDFRELDQLYRQRKDEPPAEPSA